MSSFKTFYCNINAGINQCDICCEDSYFSISIPQKPHPNKPNIEYMELFECGHGVCSKCYDKLCEKKLFCCPFCRESGVQITNFNYVVNLSLKSQGYNVTLGPSVKIINTWSEFLDEHNNNFDLLEKRNYNKFMQLYRQILNMYHIKKRNKAIQKEKDEKNRQNAIAKKKRELSRKNAICPHCGKDTFNSEKQLQCHIISKHKTK
tara:strand:+ start:4362 stop:4976 length:615 start_codon:yes stop_codon:yes gene_type:complete